MYIKIAESKLHNSYSKHNKNTQCFAVISCGHIGNNFTQTLQWFWVNHTTVPELDFILVISF